MIREWWKGHYHEDLKPYANVKNLDICLHMVKAGFGVSIVFGDFFREIYDLKTIPLYKEDGSRFYRDVNFIYSPRLSESSSMKLFISFVADYFKQQI